MANEKRERSFFEWAMPDRVSPLWWWTLGVLALLLLIITLLAFQTTRHLSIDGGRDQIAAGYPFFDGGIPKDQIPAGYPGFDDPRPSRPSRGDHKFRVDDVAGEGHNGADETPGDWDVSDDSPPSLGDLADPVKEPAIHPEVISFISTIGSTFDPIEPTGGATYDNETFALINDQPGDVDVSVVPFRSGNTCYLGVGQVSTVLGAVDFDFDAIEVDGFGSSGQQIPGEDYVVEGRDAPSFFRELVSLPADAEFLFFSTLCSEPVDSIGISFYKVDLEGGIYQSLTYGEDVVDIPEAGPAFADEVFGLEAISDFFSAPLPSDED